MKLNEKMRKNLIFPILLSGVFILGISLGAARKSLGSEAVLSVPAEVLEKAVREALPVEIEKMEGFTGKLWVRSIEKLSFGKNAVSFKAHLQGKNLGYMRQIAGYKAAMNFGHVELAVDCSATLAYDRSRRLLVIRPWIHPAEKGNELVTPLLMALVNESEYPVEIDKLKPWEARLGTALLLVHMDISSITTSNNRLMIGITPRIQKSGGVR